MKILIAGKGGSGKSTITAIIAKELAEKGWHVLVVDTDESNVGLSRMLNLGEPKDLIEGMGGRKEVGKRMREAREAKAEGRIASYFDHPWGIRDIPSSLYSTDGSISLMQVGKIKAYGEGCACVMGMLSQEFMKNLILEEKEVALVDTEAGVEHMGRGLEDGADLVLMVMDPSLESIKLFQKMDAMMKDAGKPIAVILNRSDSKVEPILRMAVKGSQIAGIIPYDERVLLTGLDGGLVPKDVDGGQELTRYLLSRIG